jgi:thiamine pyrophosphate-dependent acetolactate synthase large subunit-like protein
VGAGAGHRQSGAGRARLTPPARGRGYDKYLYPVRFEAEIAATTATRAVVAEQLVAVLELLDTTRAFGLPGVHNLALWAAVRDSGIDLIGVRHEQTCVYAADGHARATGALGVALTTTGPGAANALTATGEAFASGSPVLVVATDIPASLRRPGTYRGVLHETRDQSAMFAPVVKRAVRVTSPDDAAEALLRAGELALEPPTGPVFVEIPTDFLTAEVEAPTLERRHRPPPAPFDRELNRAAAILEGARRPLIWAGGGAVRSGAGPAVQALAERLGAPVMETYGARGLVSPDHPCWVGFAPHFKEIGALWDEADAVVAVGTDFDGTMTQNWAMPAPPALITINISPDDAGKAYAPDVALTGDAGKTAARLADALAKRGTRPDLSATRGRLTSVRSQLRRRLAKEEIAAVQFLEDLEQSVPGDVSVVADMCVAGYWIGAALRFAEPRRLAYPIGWGTLGFGFPCSIGTAMACREPTLCVCGDGGFLYAVGELSVLAEHRPPLTVLIVDDGGYGMLRYDQRQSGEQLFGVDFPTPDFCAVAQAFGIPTRQVGGLGDPLRHALGQALSSDGPMVLVLELALNPPETTSPRWYRRRPDLPATPIGPALPGATSRII